MFNFSVEPRVIYRPYPLLIFQNILDPKAYQELSSSFPSESYFKHLPKLGNKYSLSTTNNKKKYCDVIKKCKSWNMFHNYVVSCDFRYKILSLLDNFGFDLALRTNWKHKNWRSLQNSCLIFNKLTFGKIAVGGDILSSRFEFSMMSASGGHIRPHTDARSKIITLVLTMDDGTWDKSWGGGTEISDVLSDKDYFNVVNASLDFSKVAPIETIEFVPNQLSIFLKTHNSWHCVRPMSGPSEARRKTITINIEII